MAGTVLAMSGSRSEYSARSIREKGVLPRVLFVAHQTGRSANGGIQSLEEILKRLSLVQPIVLTQEAGAVTERWRQLGLDLHCWDALEGEASEVPVFKALGDSARWAPASWGLTVRHGFHRLKQVRRLVQSNVKMAFFVRERRIAVVHCNDGRSALSIAAGARLGGAAVVLNIRDTVLKNARKWRLLGRLASHIIVLSHEMAEQVALRLSLAPNGSSESSKSGTRVPLSVSYSVVDAAHMSPVSASEKEALRRNLGISPAVMAIGVVGALMAKKQQLKLLRHLVANPAQVPSAAHFFLIGDCNPETDEYSRLCVQTVRGSALAERIHLVGYSDSIRDWYRALDVVLVASAKEGLARAMIESLACGTPVTSFDCCSACEVLEAEGCGLVAPMGDFDGLMKQLVRIASDPAMRTVLSQRARQVAVRLFEPKKVVSVYEGVYLQLLKKSRF